MVSIVARDECVFMQFASVIVCGIVEIENGFGVEAIIVVRLCCRSNSLSRYLLWTQGRWEMVRCPETQAAAWSRDGLKGKVSKDRLAQC